MIPLTRTLPINGSGLSPSFTQIYVNGRVFTPGGVALPQGSALKQAINLAGGTRLLKGKVEFIRFTREGEVRADSKCQLGFSRGCRWPAAQRSKRSPASRP